MKIVKFILMLVVLLSAASAVNAQKKGEKTVVYKATLHCGSCKAKVEKNVAFEKGVKKLKVDMEAQTITVTFREDKNTAEDIKKAIEKQDVAVKSMETKEEGKEKAKPKAAADKKACDKKCC